MIITKICTICNIEKEDNFENFCKLKQKTTARCRECDKKRHKEYYKKNKEKLSVRQKEYYRNNKQKFVEYRPRYKEKDKIRRKENWRKNKEIEKERIAKWRLENKEKIAQYRRDNRERDREKQKEWRKTPSGNKIARATVQRRRAKIKMLQNDYTEKQWIECKEYFENKCAYCGEDRKLEHEHFIPLSNNGGYTKNNILPSCRRCNGSKANKNFFDWYDNYDKSSQSRKSNILKYLEIGG